MVDNKATAAGGALLIVAGLGAAAYYFIIRGKPKADFSPVPATGYAPLSVAFTDMSTGEITGWQWDFGDGSTSVEQNPTHTFNDPGDYLVSLTVTSSKGTSTIEKLVVATEVNGSPPPGAPVADFTVSQIAGVAPLTVEFTNESYGDISGILWDFGDGTTSVEENPVHVFNSPGSYQVTLTVDGPGGTDSVFTTITANPTQGEDRTTVRLRSIPSGATLGGDIPAVPTPVDVTLYRNEDYEIIFSMAGKPTVTAVFTTTGDFMTVTADLDAGTYEVLHDGGGGGVPPNPAWVSFSCDVGSLALYINGEFVQNISSSGTSPVGLLPGVSYQIQAGGLSGVLQPMLSNHSYIVYFSTKNGEIEYYNW